MSDNFGDLRSLMQEHPSPALWERLVAMLDEIDEVELVDVFIPYIRGHQRHWPAAMCEMPDRWRDALLDGSAASAKLGAATRLSARERDLGDEEIFELTTCPHLDGLRQLALGYERRVPWRREKITFGCVRDILKCDALQNLTTLCLTGQHLGAESLAAILSPEGLNALRVLDMSYNDLEFLQPNSLAGISHNLDRLSLRDAELTLQGIQALTEAGLLDGLHALDLSHNRGLDIRGLIALIETPRWGALRALGLSGCNLTTGMLAELLGIIPVSSLERLEIADNALFGEDTAQVLLALELLGSESAGLKHLDLGRTGLDDRAMISLANGELLRGLDELGLAGNQLGAEAIAALSDTDFFQTRRALDLSENLLGDEGFSLLLERCHLLELRTLRVGNNQISDEALAMLAEASLPNLEVLDLSNNQITVEGARLLLEEGVLPSLKTLDLGYNTISEYDEPWTELADLAARREIMATARGGWAYYDEYDMGSEAYDDAYE